MPWPICACCKAGAHPAPQPSAEQGLYEQLDSLLTSWPKRPHGTGKRADGDLVSESSFAARTGHIHLCRPDATSYSGNRGRVASTGTQMRANAPRSQEAGKAVILATQLVGRLPGRNRWPCAISWTNKRAALKPLLAEGEDFGDSLIGQGPAGNGPGAGSGPGCAGPGRSRLGPHFKSGAGAADHLELTAPLPRPTAVRRWPGPAQLSGRRHPSERTQLLPRLPRNSSPAGERTDARQQRRPALRVRL